jgi:hypothetical protein
LDYLFDLSKEGIIQPNLIMACFAAPADGSLFMLEPQPGDYEKLQAIVKEQSKAKQNKTVWDPIKGWGHAIQKGDEYRILSRRPRDKKLWDFYAGHTDQGLLYHWVRYVKENVTIVVGGDQYHYQSRISVTKTTNAFTDYKEFDLANMPRTGAWKYKNRKQVEKLPYEGVIHFNAHHKPWEQNLTHLYSNKTNIKTNSQNGLELWFYELQQLEKDYGLEWILDGFKSTSLLGLEP